MEVQLMQSLYSLHGSSHRTFNWVKENVNSMSAMDISGEMNVVFRRSVTKSKTVLKHFMNVYKLENFKRSSKYID